MFRHYRAQDRDGQSALVGLERPGVLGFALGFSDAARQGLQTMTQANELIDRLNNALNEAAANFGAEECHGTLAGMFCSNNDLTLDEWLDAVEAQGAELSAEAKETLRVLYTVTREQLNDSVLDFHPLLPADDAVVDERVEALGQWCQGFLLGLSSGKIVIENLPDDSGEILRDMLEISRISRFDLEGGEEDEESYQQLLEYVRTGVLLLNEEINPTKAPPREERTLH